MKKDINIVVKNDNLPMGVAQLGTFGDHEIESKTERQEVSILDLSQISDSTSIQEVVHFIQDEDTTPELADPDIVDQIERFANTPVQELLQDQDKEQVVRRALRLAALFERQINVAICKNDGKFVLFRIQMGKCFIKIQELVNQRGKEWVKWVKENIKFLSLRSVQDYMRLARTPQIEKYAMLGKERLIILLRALEKAQKLIVEDPIGSFMAENGIQFDPEAENDFDEFKIQVDVAMISQRLVNEGITCIPRDKVEILVRDRIELRAAHLRAIKNSRNPIWPLKNTDFSQRPC